MNPPTLNVTDETYSFLEFIMLENLVAKFGHPSILDLKMGTQTHGDDESDAKKAGKKRKAENSTTKELGVRLHGMQVCFSQMYSDLYLNCD